MIINWTSFDDEMSKLAKQDFKDNLKDLGAGAIAGAASSLIVAPIDRVSDAKATGGFLGTSFSRAAKHNTFKQIKEIINISRKHYEGKAFPAIRGFYTGAGVKALKLAPATAISFLLFQLLKSKNDNKS